LRKLRGGEGREEGERRRRKDTLRCKKQKKLETFLKGTSPLYTLSLSSPPRTHHEKHSPSLPAIFLSQHTACEKKKAKGEENAPLSLAFTLRIKVAFIVEPFGVPVFREQLRFVGFEVRPRFIFVPV
jgi:hypothetical protein